MRRNISGLGKKWNIMKWEGQKSQSNLVRVQGLNKPPHFASMTIVIFGTPTKNPSSVPS